MLPNIDPEPPVLLDIPFLNRLTDSQDRNTRRGVEFESEKFIPFLQLVDEAFYNSLFEEDEDIPYLYIYNHYLELYLQQVYALTHTTRKSIYSRYRYTEFNQNHFCDMFKPLEKEPLCLHIHQ